MATSFNSTLVAANTGKLVLSGSINATAVIQKGGAEYKITGDIVGTAYIDGTPDIKIVGVASGLLSGNVNAKIKVLGNGTYSLTGTVGNQTLSGGGQVKGNNTLSLAGVAT